MPSSEPQGQWIVQIVGYKNTGKTTMVCRLTERFKQAGYKVATVKRDAHDFQMDTPGTDTWKHQEAGADFTAITSSARTAILKQHPETLQQLIGQLAEADVILVEGFKTEPYPKIIMLRTEADLELLRQCSHAIAVAAWPEAAALASERTDLPVLQIDQTTELYDTLLERFSR
ncbi:molybdopterin-guanine dinucleotide biosynthesis protein B [Paenibacillus sp. N4]|uniref:molybdopterin-guanine dinucleotide biosynthesis protein B n=1 Tax=Paenibacillus vietnamensis TaxID=2590547 RepID=UPI001CD08812|nr:molybdopterin-guanine dinucleotide biosynthesis protein B [Paenibacillus vietnamensis]MCA0757802.1 molybdopterin-guanine dinucleotide biosynthesis protein B [Paenibacillus vietnamensis]